MKVDVSFLNYACRQDALRHKPHSLFFFLLSYLRHDDSVKFRETCYFISLASSEHNIYIVFFLDK